MQTFLPSHDFAECAHILDMKRLGKQRVEAFQILNIITTENYTGAWRNHPAVRMWRDYPAALRYYYNCMVQEWVRCGYNNTMNLMTTSISTILPPWLDDKLILSHRSNLTRKSPEYYQGLWPDVPNNLPYVWPI